MKTIYNEYKNTKEIDDSMLYNKNLRNNQNYIISDDDKKYIIYSHVNKGNNMGLLFTILIIFLILISGIGIVLSTFSLYLLFGFIFLLFFLFFYFIYNIFLNYYSTIRKIRRINIFFMGKQLGLLIKKDPIGMYKDYSHYFLFSNNDNGKTIPTNKELADFNNDFIYKKYA